MNCNFVSLLVVCAVSVIAPQPAPATVVTMSWSPVGNPGNAADPATGAGAVPYSFNIGTYDVTVSQYVVFLNANDPAGADPLVLYAETTNGGINFNSGAPAGQMYNVQPGDGNHPASYISWFNAIRFANWMDNGQPVFATEPTAANNATENGAYTLLGFAYVPSNAFTITRNSGATIFIPTNDEWYKAAYYNPATSSYYLFGTSSNTTPTATGPTAAPNSANYDGVGGLTDVGAYTLTITHFFQLTGCNPWY